MNRWIRLGLTGVVLAGFGTGCRSVPLPWRKAGPSATEAGATAVKPSAAPGEEAAAEPARYVRRVHLRFRNEQEVGEYTAAAAHKREAFENYRALRRLLMEKARDVQAINETLEQEYKLAPGGRYEYDEATRTVLEVQEDGRGGVSRKEALKLADPEVEKRVARLLEARLRAREEAAALQSGLARREAELVQLQNAMAQAYGVSRDREYVLESKSRALTERVPVPARFAVEGKAE